MVKDTVNIQIGDVNDNAPNFHGQPYTVNIPEVRMPGRYLPIVLDLKWDCDFIHYSGIHEKEKSSYARQFLYNLLVFWTSKQCQSKQKTLNPVEEHFPLESVIQTDENFGKQRAAMNFQKHYENINKIHLTVMPIATAVSARWLRLIYGDHLLFIVHFGLCHAGNSSVLLHLWSSHDFRSCLPANV